MIYPNSPPPSAIDLGDIVLVSRRLENLEKRFGLVSKVVGLGLVLEPKDIGLSGLVLEAKVKVNIFFYSDSYKFTYLTRTR